MTIIYEPKGEAREYARLAVNLFKGCRVGCEYCYGPGVLRKSREDYYRDGEPKGKILERLAAEAKKMAGDPREILLCFIGDVYQDSQAAAVTQEALIILGENNLKATVLTKMGLRAMNDFYLLKKYGFSFGSTVVFDDDEKRQRWEPGAAFIESRYEAIEIARAMLIRTWVSLEPVIDTEEAIKVIKKINPWVDLWRVGKINYKPGMGEEIKEIEKNTNWARFYREVTGLLGEIKAEYYIKKSLKKYKN